MEKLALREALIRVQAHCHRLRRGLPLGDVELAELREDVNTIDLSWSERGMVRQRVDALLLEIGASRLLVTPNQLSPERAAGIFDDCRLLSLYLAGLQKDRE